MFSWELRDWKEFSSGHIRRWSTARRNEVGRLFSYRCAVSEKQWSGWSKNSISYVMNVSLCKDINIYEHELELDGTCLFIILIFFFKLFFGFLLNNLIAVLNIHILTNRISLMLKSIKVSSSGNSIHTHIFKQSNGQKMVFLHQQSDFQIATNWKHGIYVHDPRVLKKWGNWTRGRTKEEM